MWKAWVGFNVSHSMGLMLFGLIYPLTLRNPDVQKVNRFSTN
jgi:hypothetical protein